MQNKKNETKQGKPTHAGPVRARAAALLALQALKALGSWELTVA